MGQRKMFQNVFFCIGNNTKSGKGTVAKREACMGAAAIDESQNIAAAGR